MERRPHPRYFRKVAGYSVGLFFVSMACLRGGLRAPAFGLPLVSDVLYFAFAASAIVLLVVLVRRGRNDDLPQCGRHLKADPRRIRHENLTFICPDCDIEWDTGRVRGYLTGYPNGAFLARRNGRRTIRVSAQSGALPPPPARSPHTPR